MKQLILGLTIIISMSSFARINDDQATTSNNKTSGFLYELYSVGSSTGGDDGTIGVSEGIFETANDSAVYINCDTQDGLLIKTFYDKNKKDIFIIKNEDYSKSKCLNSIQLIMDNLKSYKTTVIEVSKEGLEIID